MSSRVVIENLEVETEAKPVFVQKHRLSSIMPIIVFSYIGVLIRLGLAFLGNEKTPINAAFWANFVGCFVMGFIVEQKLRIQDSFAQLYVGLTTGLCGSITTFSGLMYQSCVALFGPSSQFTFSVSNYLTLIISVFASSFVGFLIGGHLSLFIFPSKATAKKSHVLPSSIRIWFFPVLIILSIPALVLLVVLLHLGYYTYFIYSVIFAPIGSLTRYMLSIFLNTNPKFPLGTWLANVLGSFIYLGMIAVNEYVQKLSPLATHIIFSVIQGYCGCLTTISTFILELSTMKKRKYAYIYFFASVLPVQIVYIILGDIFSYLCFSRS